MACKICGKSACTECFHSIEEQEEFETKTGRYTPDEYEHLTSKPTNSED